MSRWHEKSCRRPDVEMFDGEPCCINCGSSATTQLISSADALSSQNIPPDRNVGDLCLHWPRSVQYVKTYPSDGDAIGGDSNFDFSDGGDDEHLQSQPATPLEISSSAVEPLQRKPSLIHRHINEANGIRLLVLHGGIGSDPIHCTLDVTTLRGCSPYEAVSYTWADETGDSSRCKRIFVGDHWDTFLVTTNCEMALRRLRSAKEDRTLWIDSICINQADTVERSQQVSMMRDVFRQASRVVAFLGAEHSGSDVAMAAIQELDIDSNSRGPFTEHQSDMLRNLFSRPYFHRLWIIQEILLAKAVDIYCGNSVVISHETDGRLRLQYLSRALGDIVPVWMKHFKINSHFFPKDLLTLLTSSYTSNCSDPRDKIYALFGLIEYARVDELTPDYSLSTQQVYIGITAYFLQVQRRFDILAYAGTPYATLGLPTWVRNWMDSGAHHDVRNIIPRFCEITGAKDRKTLTHASQGFNPSTVDINCHTGILHLVGFRLCDLTEEPRPFLLGLSKPDNTSAWAVMKLAGSELAAIVMPEKYMLSGACLFFLGGCDLLFVLRKVRDLNTYILVGQAYLVFGAPPPLEPFKNLQSIWAEFMNEDENTFMVKCASYFLELSQWHCEFFFPEVSKSNLLEGYTWTTHLLCRRLRLFADHGEKLKELYDKEADLWTTWMECDSAGNGAQNCPNGLLDLEMETMAVDLGSTEISFRAPYGKFPWEGFYLGYGLARRSLKPLLDNDGLLEWAKTTSSIFRQLEAIHKLMESYQCDDFPGADMYLQWKENWAPVYALAETTPSISCEPRAWIQSAIEDTVNSKWRRLSRRYITAGMFFDWGAFRSEMMFRCRLWREAEDVIKPLKSLRESHPTIDLSLLEQKLMRGEELNPLDMSFRHLEDVYIV